MKEILFTTLEQFKTAVSIYCDDFLENNSIDPEMELVFKCSEITQGYGVKIKFNISLPSVPEGPVGRITEAEYSDRTFFLRYDQNNRELRERLFNELEEIRLIRVAA
jgi:hypothetical protein